MRLMVPLSHYTLTVGRTNMNRENATKGRPNAMAQPPRISETATVRASVDPIGEVIAG